MATNDVSSLEFYLVRNKEGKWFRAKGYGGSGDSWVDEVKRARVYGRIGPARAQVNFWATNYPTYGVPEIVKLTVSGFTVMDETERVKKQIAKKKEAEKKAELEDKKRRLEEAKAELEEAQRRYNSAKKGK